MPDCLVPELIVVPEPVLPERVVVWPLFMVDVPDWPVVPPCEVVPAEPALPAPVCAMADPATNKATENTAINFFIVERMFFVI